MGPKLKLDLHVHLFEAVHLAEPEPKLVREIVGLAKSKGLDGIAITDHEELGTSFAHQVKQITEDIFDDKFIVIPGKELRQGLEHVVELYLPNKDTFRFIAHPGNFSNKDCSYMNGIHGIEIENGSYYVDKNHVSKYSKKCGLLMLKNSDAHSIADIGKCYNEIAIEELQDYLKNYRKTLLSKNGFKKN